jgi:conjugal transfer pilus assembly protein TraK
VEADGTGLSASEYRVEVSGETTIDERAFLARTLGTRIFAITADRLSLKPGETARVVVVRRGEAQ